MKYRLARCVILRTVWLFVCLLFVQVLVGQDFIELSGQVLDIQTEKGIPLASVQLMGTGMGTSTNDAGDFKLSIPEDGGYLLVSSVGYADTSVVVAPGTGSLRIYMYPLAQHLDEVRVMSTYDQSTIMNTLAYREVELSPDLGGGVETLLKTMPGVASNNELSSQYNVRGGSFDENMVYVNHIEIYRPLLVRSGRQEGLSFVNSDMVSSIKFSAGGFDASYGDKMASVLDIRYAIPDSLSGSAAISLLGGRAHVMGRAFNKRLSFNIGARYKTTKQLLGTTDTDGDYQPRFADIQSYLTYQLSDQWRLEFLGNYNQNRYAFVPTTRTTSFGTLANSLNLTVYYQGEEADKFDTGMGALSLSYEKENKWQLQFISSYFATAEIETYDILGQYALNELDKSMDSDAYDESRMNLGVGTFLNHARNELFARVWSSGLRGARYWNNVELRWGATYKHEYIDDQVREWNYLDSANFSLPRNNGHVELWGAKRADNIIESNRVTAYILGVSEHTSAIGKIFFNGGLRTHYWDLAKKSWLSPRISMALVPYAHPEWRIHAAVGLYYQPPFYKEMRKPDGRLNRDINAQQAIHYLLGSQWQFQAWGRPFQLQTEVFYKAFSELIPFKQDNVQLQYAGENLSTGYATGIDLKINGEFVPGVQSWASLSILKAYEDISGDTYTLPDGTVVSIGEFPRATDQRVNFSLYFQDYVPGYESYRMYLNLHYGGRLPFALPENDRYDTAFRIPPYRRVDIGVTKVFDLNASAFVKQMQLSVEVFNLIDINNTISYLWVKTVGNQSAQSGFYAVPNYLTGRMVNFRFAVNF